MIVSYDKFLEAFLCKITEYNFLSLPEADRQLIIDGYMKRAMSHVIEVCSLDAVSDDESRAYVFNNDLSECATEEIVDIVTEGMLVQWMKQHMYKQENLENMLNTADFTSYSPAELLYRITNAYNMCKRDFTNHMREYSYRHGDLSGLHL